MRTLSVTMALKYSSSSARPLPDQEGHWGSANDNPRNKPSAPPYLYVLWRNWFITHAFLLHSTSAWHCHNRALLCTDPSMAQLPGGCHPHQHCSPSALSFSRPPHTSIWLCAKYSINHDIKRLVMTLLLSGHYYVISIWRKVWTGFLFSPGTTPCLHSQAASRVLVLSSTPW